MAITDTQTHDPAAAVAERPPTPSGFPQHRGLGAVFGSGDHKTIGRLYIGCSLLFGVAMLALTAAFNANGSSTFDALGGDDGVRAFTLSQLGLVLLVLMPLFLGLATAITPLQVGARTVAFPRAAAAAFWTWLAAGIALCASYLPSVEGGINMQFDSKEGSFITFLAILLVCGALLLGTVCVVTTIVTLRTSGMHLDQVPLFSWAMLTAGGIWLLTVPVFMANVLLVFMDAKYGAPTKFGAGHEQWAQLAWFVTQPQIFAFAIPVLGIAGDILVTFGRVRQPQRGASLFAIGLFGALSLGAYAQPAFFPGVWLQWVYVSQCLALALPVLIMIGGMLAALRKGKPKMGGAPIAALLSLLLLLLAAVAAAPFGIGRLGLQYTSKPITEGNLPLRVASTGSPVYAWGVLALVVGAALVGAVAGLAYWSPKIGGKKQNAGITTLLALGGALGAVLAGLPLCVLGFANKSESLVDSRDAMFTAAAAGAAVLAAVALVALVSTLASRISVLSNGSTTPDDAWEVGQSLEWACASPPEPGNFGTLAHVVSPQPLMDLAERAAEADGGAS